MIEAQLKKHVRLLRMIAHPVRLMILEELLKGMKCVGECEKILELRQPTVSQHLAALRHLDLVDAYSRGTERCYYLTKPELVRDLLRVLEREYPVTIPRLGYARQSAGVMTA